MSYFLVSFLYITTTTILVQKSFILEWFLYTLPLQNSTLLSLSMLLSGVFCSIPLFFIVRTRLYKGHFIIVVMLLPLFVYWLSLFKNIVFFFFCYELFLLPSFLIIFFSSPNIRYIYASIYFLMWTQVGSFCIFLGVLYIVTHLGIINYAELNCILPYVPSICILVGFGIKVPMWPFHYWLTKTHVEAPTFFSIYLSGFLVKTAIAGMYLFVPFTHVVILKIMVIFGIIGFFDASLKMYVQTDIKKIVAYATVQEMNLLVVGLCLNSSVLNTFIFIFIFTHTIISTLYFYTVDILYKRLKSRSVATVKGVYQKEPVLAALIFTLGTVYSGIPLSLKFLVELGLFLNIYGVANITLLILILLLNWVGVVTFLKQWLTVLFGVSKTRKYHAQTKIELSFYTYYIILLFFLTSSLYWV